MGIAKPHLRRALLGLLWCIGWVMFAPLYIFVLIIAHFEEEDNE